ncbi:MAG: hypothetical protein ACKVPX_05110 [Myxococcaceae bacterium]
MPLTHVQTAAERFRHALEMYEFGVGMMRQNLRRQFPSDSESQIDERLLEWLHHRPDETVWPHGRSVPWPRTTPR